MICMPSSMYTKVSLLEIPSLLTKPFTKDIFGFICFLFNQRCRWKIAADMEMMGRVWILFPFFQHPSIAVYDYTTTIVIFYYCFIIAWNLKSISHPMHKIKVVESSLHFMKHEKTMRRNGKHKEPPEKRWAKSFLKIKKNSYYTEKDWGKEEEGWVILYKNITH